MYGIYEPWQMYAYYDLYRHKTVKQREYMDQQPNPAMLILNGVYGAPFVSFGPGATGQYNYQYTPQLFQESLYNFSMEYEQLKTVDFYLFV
jgi:hypothetical protein